MPETRRYNVAPSIGLGLAATAALAAIASTWGGLGRDYVIRATVVCGVFLAVVMRVDGHEHPFPRFGAANAVTMCRVVLMALTAGLVGEAGAGTFLWPVIGLVVLVAVLDGVDGWLARRTHMASAFGARFDMETDAAMIGVLSVLVWQHDKAGAWVLLCGAMRYVFVGAGWCWPWLARPLRSTRRGKTVAVAQSVGLSLALVPVIPHGVSSLVAAATLAALTWSFAVDVWWLYRGAGQGASRSESRSR